MGAALGHPDSGVRAPCVTWGCFIWYWLSWEGVLKPRVGCGLPPAGFWEATLWLPQSYDLWPGGYSPEAAKGQLP